MKDLSYHTISRVLNSWNQARQNSRFEEDVGLIMMRRLFTFEPRIKEVFGYSKDRYFSDADMKPPSTLMIHAVRTVQMLDCILSVLGPDTETLEEILADLGKRHLKYNVKAQYFPILGQALMYALSQVLGSSWTPELEDSWIEVYDMLSGHIMKSILNESY